MIFHFRWLDGKEHQENCPQCRSHIWQINKIFLSENPKEDWISDLLQLALKSGHFEIYKRLISKEKDKNPEDFFGKTHLHIAAQYGHEKICKFIMSKLENENKIPKDIEGNTPIDVAIKYGHENVCLGKSYTY